MLTVLVTFRNSWISQSEVCTFICTLKSFTKDSRLFRKLEVVKDLLRMGRRKSKRQAPQKRKAIEPLDVQFTCPFCNHEKSCEVKMEKSKNTARIVCRVCLEDYQTNINILSEPVDVYNDWIDACDVIN